MSPERMQSLISPRDETRSQIQSSVPATQLGPTNQGTIDEQPIFEYI